jgi:hypothetical protein
MEENKVKYEKILVARHSPENKCFADEGAILILKPKKISINNGHVSHHFLDHRDGKTKSRYGWVKLLAEPITLDQFITKYLHEANDLDLIEHNKVMLNSIQKYNPEVPIAVTYSERGVEKKHMDLTVHKVFFH